MHHVTAVIAAGGSGSRMGAGTNKQYLDLLGKPLLAHTLEVFQLSGLVMDVAVVVPAKDKEYCVQNIIKPFGFTKVRTVVAGGMERQESVFNGLMNLPAEGEFVAVHDGARPLLLPEVLEKVIRAAFDFGCAAAAVPVKDTIKVSDDSGFIVSTPERDRLWSVQTPQVFKKDILVRAHAEGRKNATLATDDAALVEKLGLPVKLVQASYENIKVTTPEDLELAALILERRRRYENGDGI